MNPIICPQCKAEVIPHETHKQRWDDCWAFFMKGYDVVPLSDRVHMAINLFNELNDFEISESIHKSQIEAVKLRAKTASDNIRKYKEAHA